MIGAQLIQGLMAGLTARKEDWLSWSIQSSHIIDVHFDNGAPTTVRSHSSRLSLEVTLKSPTPKSIRRSWSAKVAAADAIEEIFALSETLGESPCSSLTRLKNLEEARKVPSGPLIKHLVNEGANNFRGKFEIVTTRKYRENEEIGFRTLDSQEN